MNEQTNIRVGELIEGIAEGKIEGLDELYLLMNRVMQAVAMSYLHNPSDAEDVMHDTFLIIVKKAKQFSYKKNGFAWINKILVNIAKNKLKKTKRYREVPLINADNICADVSANDEIVRDMLEKLTDYERKLMIFRYWYCMTLQEIAICVKKPKSTVAYQVEQTEKKLKNL